MTTHPYISFVLAARNDNYGGDFLHRIHTFFEVLLYYVKCYNLECEIIVIEWNPPTTALRLYKVLDHVLKKTSVPIRFIEVPKKLHDKFPNADKIPVFEYIAKNVGIRRARGEFILITNPDIIFPSNLIKYLSMRRLDKRCFYRIDRFDVNTLIPAQLTITQKLSFAQSHAFRLHTLGYSVPLLTSLPFRLRSFFGYLHGAKIRFEKRKEDYFEHYIHTNAAGDFILMSRSAWHSLYGFPQLPTHYLIDTYLCCMAYSSGLPQKILSPFFIIFHVEHNRPGSNRPPTSYAMVKKDCIEMLTKKIPKCFNTSSWGLYREKLAEYRFGEK